MKSCSAFAPASIGNMITGFDVLGFALERPGDVVTVTKLEGGPPGVHMNDVSVRDDVPNAAAVAKKLSSDTSENIAGFVIKEIWAELPKDRRPHALAVDLQKGCGIGTGLGSSAASAAAAAFAGLSLLASPTEAALLDYGLRGECLASGSRHADNLAPSLMGGVVGVRSLSPIDVFRVPSPAGLVCAVFQPELTVLTKDAREALPSSVSLLDHVTQSANLASLIAGLHQGDLERVANSLEDIIVEPRRSQNIPGFVRLREDARALGALGAGVAGSGPTVFALCKSLANAESVLEAWTAHYNKLGIESNAFTSRISNQGARLVHSAPNDGR